MFEEVGKSLSLKACVVWLKWAMPNGMWMHPWGFGWNAVFTKAKWCHQPAHKEQRMLLHGNCGLLAAALHHIFKLVNQDLFAWCVTTKCVAPAKAGSAFSGVTSHGVGNWKCKYGNLLFSTTPNRASSVVWACLDSIEHGTIGAIWKSYSVIGLHRSAKTTCE